MTSKFLKHPKGFQWQLGLQVQEQGALIDKLNRFYHSYGFLPMDTPILTRTLNNSLSDENVLNDLFILKDKDQKSLTLRYDMTSSLVDFVRSNYQHLPKPLRRYQSGFVFRDEKPAVGRFRQFYQSDVDCIGMEDIESDAEMCLLMHLALEHIGIAREEHRIRIGHRGILNGILDTLEIHDQKKRFAILRVIDKKDRLGQEDLFQLLGDGRKDASGDFTAGVKLSSHQISGLEPLLSRSLQTLKDLENLIALCAHRSPCARKAFEDCERVLAYLQNFGHDHVFLFDASIVRGLNYYTGLVFEASLSSQEKMSSSRKKTALSIGGGGRYDGLIVDPSGNPLSSTGFSLGVSRIHAWMLQQKRSFLNPEIRIIMLNSHKKTVSHDFQLAQDLRKKGYIVEMSLSSYSFKKQLRYADKGNFNIALIQGEQELETQTITVKNLVQGRLLSKDLKKREEWLKHNSAQKVVPKGALLSYLENLI